MLNDESFGFEKHVSQGDHEGNLEAADERTKKPDEAKSGKDAERKKVQGGANNGRL